MTAPRPLLVAACIFSLVGAAEAEDWPQWRYDANRSAAISHHGYGGGNSDNLFTAVAVE